MKKHCCYKSILILLFILPIKLFAQQLPDLSGLWKGELYDDTTQKYIPYDLAISEEKGKFSGYSYAVFKTDSSTEYGLKDVKIKIKDDKIIVEDMNLISDNYSVAPSKRVKKLMILTLEVKDSVLILSGKWKTNWTKEYHPVTGSVEVKRKNYDWKEQPILKKLAEMKLSNDLSFLSEEQKNELAVNNSPKPTINTSAKTDAAIRKDSTTIAIAKPNKKEKKPEIKPIVVQEDSSTIAIAKPNKKEKKSEAKKNVEQKDSSIVALVEPVKKNKKEDKSVVQKEKIKEKTEQPIVAKKDVPEKPVIAAANANKRKTATIRTIEYNTDSLLFTLYDNGVVDGDTVSILMNGNLIFSKEGLTEKGTSKTIYTKDIPDSLLLVLYAESLGTIPPNTGLLVIKDGKARYEVYFSADLENNAAIVLRRKRE
ncbi:hypothetical protein [Ferruginibacter albus]|uniref:hypothetical protein n=1 Tax=Ferruginibacter albus TaxID=2875540 RepID=UPI001CC4A3E3|nr:hypothetical protein [Ferruginibacter albus]UAY52122.1 hypothetical protein K9M53_00160 [Ferruginibacter albus]